MTLDRDNNIAEEAVNWHIRLSDCDSAAWEDFTLWLEADPRHVVAFDAVTAAGFEIDDALVTLPTPVPMASNENDAAPANKQFRPRWIGGALAASLALFSVGVLTRHQFADQRYVVGTQPGEQRNIIMADGTRIALNGATQIELDHADARYAALKSGEAIFEVVHDATHPFSLHVGATEVRDVGTVFNVVREQDEDIVEVKEGRVLVDPARNAVALSAGQILHSVPSTGQYMVEEKRIDAIGSWREGRLSYQANSFYLVAQDVSRNLGVQVKVDPTLVTQKFSGTIQIDHNRSRFFKNLGALLGTRIEQDGAAWRITASGN